MKQIKFIKMSESAAKFKSRTTWIGASANEIQTFSYQTQLKFLIAD